MAVSVLCLHQERVLCSLGAAIQVVWEGRVQHFQVTRVQ